MLSTIKKHSSISLCYQRALACLLLEGNKMIQRGVTVRLRSKVLQTNIAASVTSHSCQVLGLSTPWHLSNPSYHKLSPPASRQLISPDTSHSPDRESLYPENNPALLLLLPKSVPVPLCFCLSSLYFSLPSPSLSVSSPLLFSMAYSFSPVSICLCQTIYSSSSIALNLSSPSFLLHPHSRAGHIIPLLMRIWEKRLWLPIEE